MLIAANLRHVEAPQDIRLTQRIAAHFTRYRWGGIYSGPSQTVPYVHDNLLAAYLGARGYVWYYPSLAGTFPNDLSPQKYPFWSVT